MAPMVSLCQTFLAGAAEEGLASQHGIGTFFVKSLDQELLGYANKMYSTLLKF